MALIALILLAGWTALVVRLLCARATLSEKSLLTFFVFGALLGPIVSPMAQKLFDPYNETGPWLMFFVCLARQLPLLLPLFLVRRFPSLSIVDAFALAFMAGFGFDLSATFVAAASAAEPLRGLSFWPPWEVKFDAFSVAGYSYWTGFIALVLAASQRYLRTPKFVWTVTAVALLIVVVEAASLLLPTPSWLSIFRMLNFHGKLTAWIVIAAVVALSFYEAAWSTRLATEAASDKFRLLEEWQTLLRALARRDFKGYAALREQYALRRQNELIRAESAAAPDDPRLAQLTRDLRVREWEVSERNAADQPAPAIPAQPWSWRSPRNVIWGAWLALLFVIVVVPRLAAGVGAFLWSFPLLHYRLPAFPLTLLQCVLVFVLVRRHLLSAARPTEPVNIDDVVRFEGENAILKTAMGIVLIVLVYAHPEHLYPFSSMPAHFSGVRVPPWNALQVGTVLLLFATAATGITVNRSRRWQEVPLEERRKSAFHNALQLAIAMMVVWLCNAIYVAWIVQFHANLGATLFNLFGRGGNYAAAFMTAVLTGLIGFAIYRILGAYSNRIEKFVVG